MPSKNEYLTPLIERNRMRKTSSIGDIGLEFANSNITPILFSPVKPPVARTTGNGVVYLRGGFHFGGSPPSQDLLIIPAGFGLRVETSSAQQEFVRITQHLQSGVISTYFVRLASMPDGTTTLTNSTSVALPGDQDYYIDGIWYFTE